MKDNIIALELFSPPIHGHHRRIRGLNSYGARYVQALMDLGFKGRLYAVNHSGMLGHRIFRSICRVRE